MKFRHLAQAIVALAIFYPFARVMAISSYQGQVNQQVNFGGVPQPITGTVTSTSTTVGNSSSTALWVQFTTTQPVSVSGAVTANQGSAQGVSGAWPFLLTDGVHAASVTASGALIVDETKSTQSVSMVISTYAPTGSTSVTTSSTQLLAANAARRGLECTSICTNNDRVFIHLNTGSATTSDYPLEACSSWEPARTVSYTGAIQVIANSGTQVIRCNEYQ